MTREGTFSQSLSQYYRQYIQFLNDLIIKSPMTQLLFIFPNLGMVLDVLLKLNPNNQLIKYFSLFGVKQIIRSLMQVSQSISQILLAILLILQLIPLFMIISILGSSFLNRKQVFDIGQLKSNFQRSLWHKLMRLVFVTNQYILLPIICSISIGSLIGNQNEIHNQLNSSNSLYYLLLIITPINYLFGQYHALEIHWQNPQNDQKILIRINFPNNIIDVILIYAYIIVVHLTHPHICFIAAICIYSARVAVAFYFPCYERKLNQDKMFVLLSSGVFTIGIYLAYLSQNIFTMLFFVMILMFIFWNIKQWTNKRTRDYIQIEKKNEQLGIDQLKKYLWKDGLFTFVYRQLIILERKNGGYRQDLIISILKQKCYLSQLQSRGGAKIVNSQDLIKFQKQFVNFLKNLLLLADRSVSILKLLQKKQAKPEIFVEQVSTLVQIINENKKIIKKMLVINQFSSQANQLLLLLFRIFYNDSDFLKQISHIIMNSVNSILQKKAKLKLFNKKSSVVFINILEDVGKITQASKNLPAVLGYSPHNLIGLSINQIIPYSIKPYHDQHLINFVNDYSKRTKKRDPKIQFYAYNKDFHLQNVIVSYYFIMNYFKSFQLSGAFKKIQIEQDVILTDYYGNLQGWTAKLGDKFCFDDIPVTQCRLYNIFPLIPSLIKYLHIGKGTIQTIFLKPSKINHQNLVIMDYNKAPENDAQIWEKLLQRYSKFIETDQIMEGFLAQIILQTVQFCSGHVRMRKIIIRNLRRIQNFSQIQDIMKKKLNENQIMDSESKPVGFNSETSNNDMSTSFLQQDHQSRQQKSQQFTIENSFDQNSHTKLFDTNFTLNMHGNNTLSYTNLRFEKLQTRTMNNTSVDFDENKDDQCQDDQQRNEDFHDDLSRNTKGTNNFSPVLQETSNFTLYLILLALIFFGLVIYDQIFLIQMESFTLKQCQKVIYRNRALMIYSKTVFNPNMTFIQQFSQGKMIQQADWMTEQTFSFETYFGSIVNQTKFYLFNIQIPSTLQRIALSTNSLYVKQIQKNFKNIVKAFYDRIIKQKQIWKQQISNLRNISILRQIFIFIGFIIYSVFLITMYLQYRKQKKNVEAFFKFQKTDLQQRILKIHHAIQISEKRTQQWHVKKDFYQIIKNQEITNCPLTQYKANYEQKIKFDTDEEKQNKIGQTKFYLVLGFIVGFVIAQVFFVITYQYLYIDKISFYQQIPVKLDQACKLFVLPNLQIAGLFQNVSSQITAQYYTNLNQVLQKPINNIPRLFPLLETAPCLNCTILYPLLTTNFRSYYSNFQQIIMEKKAINNLNVTDLWKSVDIVIQKIMSALVIENLGILWPIILGYLIFLVIFFIMIGVGIRSKNQQKEKLQTFLKYFSEQTLIKNKHMNSLLNKNI